jgi:aldehyde dehydrogenase (NAD+)
MMDDANSLTRISARMENTMPNPDYSTLVAQQREFFLSGGTRPVAWRKAQLGALKALFTENHDELCDALWKDLRRNVVDADLMDVA